MKNFLFNSLVNEINQELLYITYNYQSDFLDDTKIKKFDIQDYQNLSKSKELKKLGELLEEYIVSNNLYTFNLEAIEILKKQIYEYETLSKLINIINPYIKDYKKDFDSFEKELKDIINPYMKDKGYSGEYPVYVDLKENNLKISRVVPTLNSKSIIYKESKKLSFKITYMDYDVPLKDYTYKGINLKDKNKDEIFKLLDNSLRINLNNTKYFDSTPIFFIDDGMEFYIPSKNDILLKLEHKNLTYGGFKSAFKDSFKRTGISLLIIIAVTILLFIFKYVIR